MNWYFYKIFLPLLFLWTVTIYLYSIRLIEFNFFFIIISWILIGPIGIGIGFHRLFSHRQFKAFRLLELILALLGTFAAYAPLVFWTSNHQFHHKHSDTPQDLSSPSLYGFWNSFLLARMKKTFLDKIDLKNYCTRKLLVDPKLRFLSKHFVSIFWISIILLVAIDFELLVNIYLIPIFIEHLRINTVSSMSHMKLPLSYRNHPTNDSSYNNIFLGLLTLGFGWHNNHHNNEKKLLLHENWWELDIEGLLAKLFSK